MAAIGFSGLHTGVDAPAPAGGLAQIEREPARRLEPRVDVSRTRTARIDDLRARLGDVREAAAGLRELSLLEARPSARSADASRVAATADASARKATHALEVQELARAGVATQGSTVASAAADDVLHVQAGSTVDVAIAAGDDVAAMARKINDAGAGATATVVDGRLRLTARETGTANELALTSDGGLADALALGPTLAARDARFTLDGEERTSPTNRVDDALPGVRLDLKATTAAPVELDVDPQRVDDDLVVGRMRTLVGAYNGLVDAAESAISERPGGAAATDAERRRGALYGDQGVASLLDATRRVLREPAADGGEPVDTGAELGLAIGAAGATSGRLVLDEARLRAAIAADPGAVEEALGRSGTGAERGLVRRVDDLAQRYGASADDGARGVQAAGQRVVEWRDSIDRTDERLRQREAGLRSQYVAIERSLGQLGSLGVALAPGSAIAA